MSGSFLKSRPSIFQRHRINLRRSCVWVSCLFRLIYCCVLGLVFRREATSSTWHRKPSPTHCSTEASPAKEDGSPSSASVYSMVLRNKLFGMDVVGPASPATPEKATGVSSRDLTKSPLSPVRNLFRFKSDQYAPGSPYSDSPVGSEALFSPNVGTPPKPPRKITRSPYKFEDFANHNAFTLLEKYSSTHLVFNDDIQGTAIVVLSGLVALLKLTGGRLDDHTFLFLRAGEAGTGIAELIALEIAKQGKISLNEARKRIWLVDSKGLIVKSRVGSLQHFKKPWAHEHKPCKSLLDAMESIRPTVLIGTSGVGKTFMKEFIETFSSFNEKPLILALSNPTSQSECTAEEAYSWSKGRAIFSSGSPFDPVAYDGKTFTPGQSNNAYIFPGLGLGLVMSGTICVHDDMLLAASEALAQQVTKEHLDQGLIYPPFRNIKKISAHIAAEVAAKSYELGK